MILPNFAKKLHEIEKILGHGGRPPNPPLGNDPRFKIIATPALLHTIVEQLINFNGIRRERESSVCVCVCVGVALFHLRKQWDTFHFGYCLARAGWQEVHR